jgi:hypothetical protein
MRDGIPTAPPIRLLVGGLGRRSVLPRVPVVHGFPIRVDLDTAIARFVEMRCRVHSQDPAECFAEYVLQDPPR